MPELPEVETVRQGLKQRLLGRTIKEAIIIYDGIIEYPSVKDFTTKIKNQTINDIERYGKWLMFLLDDYYLLSHLRMEGKYFIKDSKEEYKKHEQVIFKLDNK